MDALVAGIGPALKRIRLTLGLSQSQLAEKSGVPKERISRYENGHSQPTLSVLERFAHSFETTVSDIIATAEDEVGWK